MDKEITLGARIGSMILDHFAMTIICVLMMALSIGIGAGIDSLFDDHWTLFPIMGILISLTFSVYINKDVINGQSPAKRSAKHQVIDVNTGKSASPLKCLLRNFILPIWIIEIPFILINPQRRLGDYIAGTIVKPYNSSNTIEYSKKSIFISVLTGMAYMIIVLGGYFWTNGISFNVFG